VRRVVAALTGAAATAVVLRAWSARSRGPVATDEPAGSSWQRTNYRGRTVSLSGGLAAAAGACTAVAVAGGTWRTGAAGALATAGAGLLGLVDDHAPDPGAARGLRGHLRALTHGEVTTGTMKLLGIPALSLAAAAMLEPTRRSSAPLRRGLDVLCSGALIAGTANLVNLFDLRPGRALKVTGALSAPLLFTPGPSGRVAAGACGVLAASWADDLGERTMLGDTGANALGAMAGTALALLPSAAVRAGALAGVVTLIAASEKVSFSAVIDRVAVLRTVDRWGRRP